MIRIYFGTETGNAEMAADDAADSIRQAGLEAEVQDLDLVEDFDELRDAELVLFICSTYGEGELPMTAQAFHRNLTTERPSLDWLRYGAFGLGDSGYTDTHSRGIEILDGTLSELGASRLGDIGRHDALSGSTPGELAAAWALTIISLAHDESEGGLAHAR